jgi:hypothetical protein
MSRHTHNTHHPTMDILFIPNPNYHSIALHKNAIPDDDDALSIRFRAVHSSGWFQFALSTNFLSSTPSISHLDPEQSFSFSFHFVVESRENGQLSFHAFVCVLLTKYYITLGY